MDRGGSQNAVEAMFNSDYISYLQQSHVYGKTKTGHHTSTTNVQFVNTRNVYSIRINALS